MRKHRSTTSRRDKCVTLAAKSPPGAAQSRSSGGQQSGLARCMPPPLFKRGASSCSSQPQPQQKPWGASPRPTAPTYLPYLPEYGKQGGHGGRAWCPRVGGGVVRGCRVQEGIEVAVSILPKDVVFGAAGIVAPFLLLPSLDDCVARWDFLQNLSDVLHVSGVRKFIQTNFWIEFNQHSASCDSFRVP